MGLDLLYNALRTADASAPVAMDVMGSRNQVDQPFVHAFASGGKDMVCIGLNDLSLRPDLGGNGQTATVDKSTDGNANPLAFTPVRIESRSTGSAGQNGPQIRPAASADGSGAMRGTLPGPLKRLSDSEEEWDH